MKSKIFKIFLSTVLVLSVPLTNVMAQGPGDPGPDPDIKVPFDGGLSLLLAAGVSYGMKRAYDKRKQSKDAATPDKV